MRIAVLMKAQPPQIGGGHTFEQEIFQTLLRIAPESSHRFSIVSPMADVPGIPTPANVDFPLAFARPLSRLLNAAPRLWIERAVKAVGADLVWSVTPYHPVLDIPYITVVWDLAHRTLPIVPEVSAGGEWAKRDEYYASRLRRAAMILTGTEEGKDQIVRFYQVAPERVRRLPHPTPRFALEAPAASTDDVLARYRLPPRYLFYPAQFWAHKNHINLLLALRHLEEHHGLSLPLVLVGSDRGNMAHVRRRIDELGLTSRVSILGFVPSSDLIAIYRNALALVYVSLLGPDNLPPLEAFALGCPVVASDVPGSEEQLGDAALRVDATRPELLAAAIKQVHDDAALREQLVARGRVRANQWTGTDYVRGVFQILEDLTPLIRNWRP